MISRPTVEELCRKLKPVFGKKIDVIYLKYTLADSMDKKREIEQALGALYHKHLNNSMYSDKILLEPPEKDIIKGDYPLGKIIYPDKELYAFGLREQDWQRHICVSGMSGSGKTTFAFQIIGNLILKKKPFIVFDWKRSFRPLMKIDPEVILFTVGNLNVSNLFRININQPPKGVHPKEWLNILCDIINEAFFASYGVHKVMLETLDKAFKDFGVYGGSGNYPTWRQIKDRLEDKEAEHAKKTGRESEWYTSALRIAHALTFGGFGESVNYKGEHSMTVEDVLNKKVIFELDSLSNSEKKFFCQFLLTYIYKYKKANMLESRDFMNAILVDEAHNIFLKDRPTFMKEAITDVIYREIREYGTSLICLDQHVSKLSDVVAGNSACNVAFQQMLPQDVDTVSGIMQMRDFKLKKFFSMLPVGYAIVKLAERYHNPFLIKAPFIDTKKHPVDDTFIREKMNEVIKYDKRNKIFNSSCKVDKLQTRIAKTDLMMKSISVDTGIKEAEIEGLTKKDKPKGMYNWNKVLVNHIQEFLFDYACKQVKNGFSIDDIKQKLVEEGYNTQDIEIAITNVKRKHKKELKANKALQSNVSVVSDGKGNGNGKLNQEHLALLGLLLEQPGIATAELYKSLRISGRKGNKLKNELIDLGMISVVEDRNENGWTKRLHVTEQGMGVVPQEAVLS
ncbi:ATP-binding protein [Thermoproteota archaeon]